MITKESKHKPYSCPECTASCTFEAMEFCVKENNEECPVICDLKSGKITDKRPDDLDPNFPSHFTYTELTSERISIH